MRTICSAVLLCSLIILLFTTCKKDYSSTTANSTPVPVLVGEAKAYFSCHVEHTGGINPHNYRAGIGKTVLWDQAEVVGLSFGKAVIVPVNYALPLFVRSRFGGGRLLSLDGETRLFMYKDGGQVWHAELVTAFPDSLSLSRPAADFSGFRFVEDWQGNGIAKYWYEPGKAVRKFKPSSRVESETYSVIQTCNIIYGYNYAAGAEEDGVYWEEDGGCTDTYVEDNPWVGRPGGGDYGGGRNGGGGPVNVNSPRLIIASPHNVINDIKTYLYCFTNNATSSYKVTICVNQPYPGERTAWAFSPYNASSGYSNVVDAGHCFLVFTQKGSAGTITRNVGFYPDGMVTPIFSSTQGVLNDDEQHEYNISGSFSVSSSSFFAMLNYVSKGNVTGYQYDLNENNCTTFDINALAAGGINLPRTIGSWLGGSGNDPGDMGEDIRASNLISMTKSNDEIAHPNTGTCN